jgi:hypothetical protein
MTTNGKPRLGGWTRIGIVVSVLWVLGAGVAMRINDVRHADSVFEHAYHICMVSASQWNSTPFFWACHQEAWAAYKVAIAHSWGKVAIVAFGPLPLLWLIAIYRWVRRGFSPPTSDRIS